MERLEQGNCEHLGCSIATSQEADRQKSSVGKHFQLLYIPSDLNSVSENQVLNDLPNFAVLFA
jgi:hypothetical protein